MRLKSMLLQSCPRSRALALAALVAGWPRPASAADAALERVLMLPLAGRTTIVAELTEPVARVGEIASGPVMVMIEAGPVAAGAKPLDLKPIGRSSFVDHVSVRTYMGPNTLTYLRIQITLAALCAHRLRVSMSRVYVDLMPVEERAPAPPAAAAKPAAPGAGDIDAAYRDLESSILTRARELAARPDVVRLLQLNDEVLRRDEALGRRRPEAVQRLLAEVLRYTNEARVAQLEKDRRALVNAE